jgi:hypothetical protein
MHLERNERDHWEDIMSDNVGAQRTTRRAFFSLLGLTAAAGVATAATILTIGDADAQTRGMERRDNRRDDRQDRRNDRRSKKKKKTKQ